MPINILHENDYFQHRLMKRLCVMNSEEGKERLNEQLVVIASNINMRMQGYQNSGCAP